MQLPETQASEATEAVTTELAETSGCLAATSSEAAAAAAELVEMKGRLADERNCSATAESIGLEALQAAQARADAFRALLRAESHDPKNTQDIIL